MLRRHLLFFVTMPLLAACAPHLPALGQATPTALETAVLPEFTRVGTASWYGPGFAGRLTASGEVFDPSELTAAHRTLPFNTHLRVTNLANGRSVVVRINDRGPFSGGRIIDLSRAAAESIGMIGSGTARVRLEPISGVGGVLPAAPDPSLAHWDVIARGFQPGELLLLSSATSGPILVRVVGNEIPASAGAEILVSPELSRELGSSVTVQARR
ncbi:MAG TPA: septal ring lytic transglycosylase RlpA family protein [Trueperaceae bacterium]